MLPAVHAVGDAVEHERAVTASERHRRHVLVVGEIELKVERTEVGFSQLPRRVEHNAPRCFRQTAEEIYEPGTLFAEILELCMDVFADILFRER